MSLWELKNIQVTQLWSDKYGIWTAVCLIQIISCPFLNIFNDIYSNFSWHFRSGIKNKEWVRNGWTIWQNLDKGSGVIGVGFCIRMWELALRMELASVFCRYPAVQPWAIHFPSLSLSFLCYKIKLKIVLSEAGEVVKIKWDVYETQHRAWLIISNQ